MSAMQISQVLEKCQIGHSLRQDTSSWLEQLMLQKRSFPLLLIGTGTYEAPILSRSLHRASQLLLERQGPWHEEPAASLHQSLQTYGEQPLQTWKHGTLFISELAELSIPKQKDLLQTLHTAKLLQQGALLVVVSYEQWPTNPSLDRELETFSPWQLQVAPLYQRHTDIDRQICRIVRDQIEERALGEVEGLSLEATAHVHRAVLQTKRTSEELHHFLCQLFERVQRDRLPLHNGYVVAWPIARMLEDAWGYRLNPRGDELRQELAECDFQERLFSASIEHAACRSGFSKELIELQCRMLHKLVEELPPHQRNYHGLTSKVDQLQWIGMKLLSHARTQAELRDFYGFGTKGKIPKATAKLKFDQYDLEHYGYRSTDPLPWSSHCMSTELPSLPPTSTRALSTLSPQKDASPPVQVNRNILTVEGELDETLFWRHQDLFTVLAADALTAKDIAQLMDVPLKRAKQDLEELVQYKLLKKNKGRYSLSGDDMYYRHSHSRLRCLEENLMRYLGAAFQDKEQSVLDNWFLRLPEEGLPMLRETLLQPFIHEQFLPLSDQQPETEDEPYNKRMYALMLLGTHRLSPQVHGRLPMEERILYYFREASLQRADHRQKHQAICLRATQMLPEAQVKQAMQHLQTLRKELRAYLPHGRGNKPNFNLTLCFTEVPLAFYRDMVPAEHMFGPFTK